MLTEEEKQQYIDGYKPTKLKLKGNKLGAMLGFLETLTCVIMIVGFQHHDMKLFVMGMFTNVILAVIMSQRLSECHPEE